MRILIISNYYPPLEMGGWPQLTGDIADHLKKRGHEVFVLTSRHQKDRITTPEKGVERVLYLQSPDRNYYHPHYVLTDRWHEFENLRFLKQAASSFKPDVIFIHGLWNISRKVALDAERLYPDKVVYYMASYWPVETDAHTSYWTIPTRSPWLRIPKKMFAGLARKLLLSNSSSISPKFERVLCVSQYIQNCLVDQVGVPIQNTQVVYNGIDVRRFTPEFKEYGNGDMLKLIHAGGFWEHKGVTSAIEAIDYLVNTLGVRNIHLTLVGAGHPQYLQNMKRLISQTCIEDYVSFMDRVSRDQMPELLKSYDVLLFPSTWPEPLARMVQEAMASGLLVIGSTSGGTPEILHDGENGLGFETGNSKMLAEKVALAASDPELRHRLTQAARHTVEQQFTIEGMVDNLEAYFSSM